MMDMSVNHAWRCWLPFWLPRPRCLTPPQSPQDFFEHSYNRLCQPKYHSLNIISTKKWTSTLQPFIKVFALLSFAWTCLPQSVHECWFAGLGWSNLSRTGNHTCTDGYFFLQYCKCYYLLLLVPKGLSQVKRCHDSSFLLTSCLHLC